MAGPCHHDGRPCSWLLVRGSVAHCSALCTKDRVVPITQRIRWEPLMRDDTFDVSKLGFSTTPKTPAFFALGVAGFLRLRPRFTKVCHTSKSHGWQQLRPIANKNGPCLWRLVRRCGKGRKLRVPGCLEISKDQQTMGFLDVHEFFRFFLKQTHSPFFFFSKPILKGIEEEGC